MSELRERFRALDALDVPDVMSRARIMGPKPPEPDRAPPMRRVGALVFAAVVAIAAVVLVIERSTSHLDRPTPSPHRPRPHSAGTGRSSRTRATTLEAGDLVAQDPDTGEVRTLVDAHSIDSAFRDRTIGSAAWSADGRWVAFQVVACGGGAVTEEEPAVAGLWVTNGLGEPRQLTRPCIEDPDVARMTSSGHGLPPARSSWSRADPSTATRWSSSIRRPAIERTSGKWRVTSRRLSGHPTGPGSRTARREGRSFRWA